MQTGTGKRIAVNKAASASRSLVILSSLLLSIPFSAFGATINVPADYSTIQAAINAALDGDTVQVAAGVYNEMIDFHGKAITVKSTSGVTI